MKRICSIYKSPRKNEMYLYVLKAEALSRVPEALLQAFGTPRHAFDLVLSEARHAPELARLYKELAFDAWQQHVLDLLQLAVDEGELQTDSISLCAQLLASPFWMGMVHNGLLTDDPQQHVAIAPLMEQLIALLFASPMPSHPLPTRSQP